MGVYKNNKNGTLDPIATNLQVVNAPMEQFVSRAEFSAVTPNDISADNKLVAENEVTKAVDTMPTASAGLVGTIVQYVGETTANYRHGFHYECKLVDSSYIWDECDVEKLLNVHEERRNIFDHTDVTDNKYRASTLGSSINDVVDKENGWYSNQIWEVKKGDTIYQSTRWFPLLIYNENGVLVEYRTSGDTGGVYTVTDDNAKYLTIQASAHTDTYLNKLMLSINVPLPAEYVPYTDVRTVSQFDVVEEKIPTDGKAILDKGFVILSFDAVNDVQDKRFDIVSEYGFKASISCGWSLSSPKDVCTKASKMGWDIHLYSGHNWPTDNSYYVDNPSAEIQAVWDNYVKEEVDFALAQGVSNPTAWGCRQGRSCDGLENACKKYGIKMIRGGQATKFTENFVYATNALASLKASATQDCINVFTAAANIGYGVVFTTHGIYDTVEEADTNFGMTEATLRQFLTALKTLVDEGKLEVLTFREVYQKYYQNDALCNNYDRLARRAFGNTEDINELINEDYELVTPTWVTKEFVGYSGDIATTTSTQWARTDVIQVTKGTHIKFKATGFMDNVAMISECDSDGSNIVPLIISEINPEGGNKYYKDYAYTTTRDGYVMLSCFNYGSSSEPTEVYFHSLNKIEALDERVNAVEVNNVNRDNSLYKIFQKVVCVGDSYTEGYMASDTESLTVKSEYSWVSQMGDVNREWINCGVSGATSRSWLTNTKGLAKAQGIGEVQAYIIGLGINDSNKSSVPVGEPTDIGTDNDTYYGKMSKIISELATVSPDAIFFVNTCPFAQHGATGRLDPYNVAIRTMVAQLKSTYKIHCIDLVNDYADLYYDPNHLKNYKEAHPTALGHAQIAQMYKFTLSDYISKHIHDFMNVPWINFDEDVGHVSISTLKSVVAASSDFADFQTRIAAL